MSKKKEVKRIKATNTLAQKIGWGEVEAEKVEAAQKTLDDNKVDFSEVAKPFLAQLHAGIAAAKKGINSADQKVLLSGITFPIMNLKANAATFNYQLISEAAGAVLNFLDSVETVDEDIIVIADNLQKAITVIIAQKMFGAENPAGRILVKEFKDVCSRYLDKRT